MFILSRIYETFIDALFPLSSAEREALSLSPEEALRLLPPAPGYAGLAVSLPNARSIFAYKDERVSKLVWSIKYKKSEQAVRIGGFAIWKRVHELCLKPSGAKDPRDTPSTSAEVAAGSPSSLLESADSPSLGPKRPSDSLAPKSFQILPTPLVVIPIPITERRRKERGYNQCELLLDEVEKLHKESADETGTSFLFEKRLLIRTHHASRQTLKGRTDRIESAQGIFGIDEKVLEELLINDPAMKNRKIIVLDDVITTGSTMFQAIETLTKAGFTDVCSISLAH